MNGREQNRLDWAPWPCERIREEYEMTLLRIAISGVCGHSFGRPGTRLDLALCLRNQPAVLATASHVVLGIAGARGSLRAVCHLATEPAAKRASYLSQRACSVFDLTQTLVLHLGAVTAS